MRPVALACAVLETGLVVIWVAFTVVFMGARMVVLLLRARRDTWLVTGATAVGSRS